MNRRGSQHRFRSVHRYGHVGGWHAVEGQLPVRAVHALEPFGQLQLITAGVTGTASLGLSGPWGEVMFSSWLTPYNEVTAQWIDPFYDAGSHTHSTLLGNVGWGVQAMATPASTPPAMVVALVVRASCAARTTSGSGSHPIGVACKCALACVEQQPVFQRRVGGHNWVKDRKHGTNCTRIRI